MIMMMMIIIMMGVVDDDNLKSIPGAKLPPPAAVVGVPEVEAFHCILG